MKCLPKITALLIFSLHSFSQKTVDPVKQISEADTVVLIAKMNGCFGAGQNIYKLVKLKNKERLVIYNNNGIEAGKKITAKNFEKFITNFKTSRHYFKDRGEGGMRCTTTTDFELKNKTQSDTFSNITCEAQYDPEQFLLQLLK